MQDHQSGVQKQQRFERLLEVQHEISAAIWQKDDGQMLSVLVEGESKQAQGQLFGRTTSNRIVNFTGSSALIGQVVPVKIVKVHRNSHLGELVEP
jgi:tRNA-2-methylthio-N6-dimethylallyladenosine synthase